MTHDLSGYTLPQIEERIRRLDSWPLDYEDAIDNDPRCGCGEDGEGGKCAWDQVGVLNLEALARVSEIEAAVKRAFEEPLYPCAEVSMAGRRREPVLSEWSRAALDEAVGLR